MRSRKTKNEEEEKKEKRKRIDDEWRRIEEMRLREERRAEKIKQQEA